MVMLKPLLDGHESRGVKRRIQMRVVLKKPMTVALASKCEGGACLYADRIIIGTNGSMSEACKVWHRNLTNDRAIALATATSDFDAAQALAERILDGVASTNFDTIEEIRNYVEGHLLTWSEPYHSGELALESVFLMATAVAGAVHLHFLQPRHTIVPVPHARVIGSGEPVAKPIVDGLLPEHVPVSPQVTLLRLAYAAKRAKEQAVGRGGSNAIFVPVSGPIRTISEIELRFAEETSDMVAGTLDSIGQFLMALESPEQIETLATQWRGFLAATAKLLTDHVRFTGLG